MTIPEYLAPVFQSKSYGKVINVLLLAFNCFSVYFGRYIVSERLGFRGYYCCTFPRQECLDHVQKPMVHPKHHQWSSHAIKDLRLRLSTYLESCKSTKFVAINPAHSRGFGPTINTSLWLYHRLTQVFSVNNHNTGYHWIYYIESERQQSDKYFVLCNTNKSDNIVLGWVNKTRLSPARPHATLRANTTKTGGFEPWYQENWYR